MSILYTGKVNAVPKAGRNLGCFRNTKKVHMPGMSAEGLRKGVDLPVAVHGREATGRRKEFEFCIVTGQC